MTSDQIAGRLSKALYVTAAVAFSMAAQTYWRLKR